MTCLNVLLHGDQAMVSMDTRVHNPLQNRVWNSSKMFPLVHANILIASRGDVIFGEMVLDWLVHESCDHYDDAVRILSSGFQLVVDKVEASTGRPLKDDELVVVGWSEVGQKMQGIFCKRMAEGEPYTIHRMVDGIVAPEPAEDVRYASPDDHVPYLIDLARAQRRLTQWKYPDDLIGGKLILAEITKDQMSFRTIANLDGL